MSNGLLFTPEAFEDYGYWQTQDKKTLKRINLLLKDISRNPNSTGLGKAERLKGELSGYCSRRIDEKNRIIYKVLENDTIEIVKLREHYNDK